MKAPLRRLSLVLLHTEGLQHASLARNARLGTLAAAAPAAAMPPAEGQAASPDRSWRSTSRTVTDTITGKKLDIARPQNG